MSNETIRFLAILFWSILFVILAIESIWNESCRFVFAGVLVIALLVLTEAAIKGYSL